ncbi:serine endoprotease DegP [Buchnera aphidicola]|uniref:serine endoprotease DegP n=1 Tax=Buchnera aphidicola TaxID=9 RepID=UPI003463AF64
MKKFPIVLKTIFFLPVFLFSLGMSWNSMLSSNKNDSEFNLPSLAPMLEKVMPSVVSINIEGTTSIRGAHLSQKFEPFWSKDSPFCQRRSPFFSSPLCQLTSGRHSTQEKFRALGSGVIINAEKGYVVTNNHVIDHANKIIVFLHDGTRYEAKVIGKDSRSDIALIKLNNTKNLISIKLGDSDLLRVGDYTIAIGNPYGLGETVTSGIISALGRSGLNTENYEDFIQTDAAINRGNSGGALVNLKGELIGINTAILAPEGGNIGIGFAIPGNMVKSLTEQIALYGKVKRGELGIIGTELNSQLATVMKIDTQRGAFISQVIPNSAAEREGIKAGDVIIGFNKKPVYSFSSLRAELSAFPVNTKIELVVLRNKKIKLIIVELQNHIQNKVKSSSLFAGIEGADLSNYVFNGVKGVYIDDVKIGTAAYHIGFKKGDIIVEVNKNDILDVSGLRDIFETKSSVFVFKVKRSDMDIYLFLQ